MYRRLGGGGVRPLGTIDPRVARQYPFVKTRWLHRMGAAVDHQGLLPLEAQSALPVGPHPDEPVGRTGLGRERSERGPVGGQHGDERLAPFGRASAPRGLCCESGAPGWLARGPSPGAAAYFGRNIRLVLCIPPSRSRPADGRTSSRSRRGPGGVETDRPTARSPPFAGPRRWQCPRPGGATPRRGASGSRPGHAAFPSQNRCRAPALLYGKVRHRKCSRTGPLASRTSTWPEALWASPGC